MENVKYHPLMRALHWLVAVLILGLFAMGLYMTDVATPSQRGQLYGLHKSFGMIALALIVLRLTARQLTYIPPVPHGTPRWQALAAHLSHGALYILMLAMPISGYVMSTAGGHPVAVFGVPLPALLEKNEQVHDWADLVHNTAIWILLALVAVHVLAVIKHWRDGHPILRRMT